MSDAPNIENLKPFKKGDPRINRKGRPPVLPDLKEKIAELLSEEKSGITGLEAIIKALLAKAAKGDTRAAQELLDRYYGKSLQKTDLTNSDGTLKPIITTLTDAQLKELLKK